MNTNKILVYFLLITLNIPSFLTQIWIYNQKRLIRKEVKRCIEAEINISELIILHFTTDEIKTQLKWEHSTEFEYNNQMYDIVKKQFNGKQYTFWCWLDNKETKLNQNLSLLVRNAFNHDPLKKIKIQSLNFFLLNLILERFEINILKYKIFYSKIFHYNSNQSKYNLFPMIKPPDFFCLD